MESANKAKKEQRVDLVMDLPSEVEHTTALALELDSVNAELARLDHREFVLCR
jgi:hypothetical protein